MWQGTDLAKLTRFFGEMSKIWMYHAARDERRGVQAELKLEAPGFSPRASILLA